MTITDAIGKAFQPPFKTDFYGSYIYDKNKQVMLETHGYWHLRYSSSDVEIANLYPVLAQSSCSETSASGGGSDTEAPSGKQSKKSPPENIVSRPMPIYTPRASATASSTTKKSLKK